MILKVSLWICLTFPENNSCKWYDFQICLDIGYNIVKTKIVLHLKVTMKSAVISKKMKTGKKSVYLDVQLQYNGNNAESTIKHS